MMVTRKIIFLDIDGVLATVNEFNRNTAKFQETHEWAKRLQVPYPFNDKCVKVLNQILIETEAEIVLSSDWRNFWTLEQLDEIFQRNGVNRSPIAITGFSSSSFDLGVARFNEIINWTLANDIKRWVSIDDMKLGQYAGIDTRHLFVITDVRHGIKQSGRKKKIIELLNNENA